MNVSRYPVRYHLDPEEHISSCTTIFKSNKLHRGRHQTCELRPDALAQTYTRSCGRLVERGGGRSGPLPFADISRGRLICPLPLGGKAAVIAAQLSFNKKKKKKMHKQT